jgi:membrane-associated PAP2 superfamily phosphatase
MTIPKYPFILHHLILPSGLTLLGFIIIRSLALDEQLAALFYKDGDWPLKENWWLSQILHNLGRKLVLSVYLGLFIYWLINALRGRAPKGIGYVLFSVALCVSSVNLAKTLLHFPCPWDATQDQGLLMPYHWQANSHGCFPSGHASGGFAWLCLYYLAYAHFPRQRILGLGTALVLGLGFGIGQQIRGAHFLSHDLICAYLCWIVATLVYFFWPPKLNVHSPS